MVNALTLDVYNLFHGKSNYRWRLQMLRDFECETCEKRFEILIRKSDDEDDPDIFCPVCGGRLHPIITFNGTIRVN